MQTFPKVGLDALLTPENCTVLLIDHQPSQLANVNSHDPTIVINNVTGLAKTAKAFGIPTILTTISAKRYARPVTGAESRRSGYPNWLRALSRAKATASGPAGNRSCPDASFTARYTASATSDSFVTIDTCANESRIGFAKPA